MSRAQVHEGSDPSKCTTLKIPALLYIPDFEVPKDLYKVLKCGLNVTTRMTQKCKNYVACITRLNDMKLQEDNYFVLLKLCLYVEDYLRETEFQKNDMLEQTITKVLGSPKLFNIEVPHLNDNDKFVNVEDFVHLKGVKVKNGCTAKVVYVGKKFIRVAVTDKFDDTFQPEHKYDVKFRYTNFPIKCCHYALYLCLRSKLKDTLFPPMRKFSKSAKWDLQWFNKNVENNEEQQQAISNILRKTSFPAPYILFGPPGTGKTATLVEAICQIWNEGPSKRVLVCTPSNAAADEVASRLINYIPIKYILRMYAPSKKRCNTNNDIYPCTNFIDEKALVLPKEIVSTKKIVITTLVSCIRLFSLKLQSGHFQYVFIDESSQALEPEALLPLTLMCEGSDQGIMQGQVILAGDPWQLGPIIKSSFVTKLLGKSMLERLLAHELYKKDSKKNYNPAFITQLVKNFRSHPDILYVSNKLFYDNSLQCCGGEYVNTALQWSELPNPNFPLIFHAVYGTEEKMPDSVSSYNEAEISMVMKYLGKLIGKKFTKQSSKVIQQKDIGIISPFKLQQIQIEDELQKRYWNDVLVGTVEVFQGKEKEVIILSTVRSKQFVHDNVKHIGFLSNPKRLNVALTRPKSLLIIIGNPEVLRSNPHWNELICHCERNGALIKDYKKPPKKFSRANEFSIWRA